MPSLCVPLRLVALRAPGVGRAVPVEQRPRRAEDGRGSARSNSDDCDPSRCPWISRSVSDLTDDATGFPLLSFSAATVTVHRVFFFCREPHTTYAAGVWGWDARAARGCHWSGLPLGVCGCQGFVRCSGRDGQGPLDAHPSA